MDVILYSHNFYSINIIHIHVHCLEIVKEIYLIRLTNVFQQYLNNVNNINKFANDRLFVNKYSNQHCGDNYANAIKIKIQVKLSQMYLNEILLFLGQIG